MPTISVNVCIGAGLVIFGTGEAIGEGSPVTISLVVVIVGAAWFLATRLQKLADGQKATNHRLDKIEFVLQIKKLGNKQVEEESTT
jgi:hypothetical protein